MPIGDQKTFIRRGSYARHNVASCRVEALEDRQLFASPLLAIAIDDVSVQEGTGPQAANSAVFTVSLPGLSISPVSVQYQTMDGTAVAGSDYTAESGSIIFEPGQTSAQIFVPIIADSIAEPNEQFTVQLFNPVGADLANNFGTATIVDDDQQIVTVTATDAKASETKGDSGTFRIARAGPTDSALKVSYSLSGTAKNGVDYKKIAGSVTIGAGKLFANVTITPIADSVIEPAETVILKLKSQAAYLLGTLRSATVKITDKDSTPPTASAIAGSVTKAGGTKFQFTVNYSDDKLLDAGTVGNGDVQVIGPNGFLQSAKLVSKEPSTSAKAISAIYKISAPTGGWSAADNGMYTINVVAGQVKDKSGNALAAGSIGTFTVAVA